MIVKICCNDDQSSWRYYDADRVQSAMKNIEDWFPDLDPVLINGDGIHEDCILSCYDKGICVTLVSFISPDGTENNIYVDKATYLMTDTGETIDRLN